MPPKKISETVRKVIEQVAERRKRPVGSKNALPYGCDKCDGYGNVITEEGARNCECKKEHLIKVRLRNSNIPARFAKKTLEDFETRAHGQKKILKWAKSYIKKYSPEENRGVLLFGAPGIGKTHIVSCILKELILKGYDGLFFNMNDLLDVMRASFDPNRTVREQDIIDDLIDVDILVLDDVGAQQNISAYVLDRFYTLVNGRYQANKTLIVTTNLDQTALEQRLNYYTISRLYEMCEARLVDIDTDYRSSTYIPPQPAPSSPNIPRGERR